MPDAPEHCLVPGVHRSLHVCTHWPPLHVVLPVHADADDQTLHPVVPSWHVCTPPEAHCLVPLEHASEHESTQWPLEQAWLPPQLDAVPHA